MLDITNYNVYTYFDTLQCIVKISRDIWQNFLWDVSYKSKSGIDR